MSTLYVTEFTGIGDVTTNGAVQAAVVPSITTQTVSFTGTPGTVTNAFNANTTVVRVTVDGIACIKFSTAGTDATTSDFRMAADTVEYFYVGLNSGLKVSAITAAA